MDEPKILVAIRKRPLSKKEESKGESDIISVKSQQTVIVSEYKQKVDLTKYLEETVFNFDFAFNEETNNEEIYDHAVRPLVDSAFQGAKVTCFAYGQTGSGKTFTMNGNAKMGVYGLYTLGANDIFAYLADSRFSHLTAKLSFFEIYCGKLFDLLNKRQELTLREDNKSNINIIGLEEIQIDNLEKFQELLTYGSTQRITSQNSANAESSRSHAILQVILKEGKKVYGKISFIDLAGNERGADHTDMKKQTRIDGAEINKSLLSLKECIRALDQGKGHTPFRGSKLTMVLKDSFVGFCRTIMIGNVSPSSASSENTLNTLRYADRVKELRKPSDSLTKEEMKARELMLPRQNKNAIKININNDDDAEDIEAKRKEAQKNYGIKDESYSEGKQMQREMSSDPYKKGTETDRNRQQSFGPNNNRPLVGGLKQSQQNPIQMVSNTQPLIQPKSPSVSNNITRIDIRNPKGPITSERNIYNNNNNNDQQRKNSTNNQKGIREENRMDVEDIPNVGNRQNNNFMVNSRSNTNMSINNMNNFHGNGSQYYNNGSQQFSQGQFNQGQFNQNQNQGQFYQQNQFNQMHQNQFNQIHQNQFNQEQYNQQNNQFDQSSNYNYSQQEDRLGQYRTNYQQPPNQSPQFNNKFNQFRHQEQQRQQQQQIPEDFEEIVELLGTTEDQYFSEKLREKLHTNLFTEENELIHNHSETLKKSLDHIKSEMTLIAKLEKDRNSLDTREYLSIVQESIDEKISLLEMLREKMIGFTYKLERVEEIENREVMRAEGVRGEDEQLLDDLH